MDQCRRQPQHMRSINSSITCYCAPYEWAFWVPLISHSQIPRNVAPFITILTSKKSRISCWSFTSFQLRNSQRLLLWVKHVTTTQREVWVTTSQEDVQSPPCPQLVALDGGGASSEEAVLLAKSRAFSCWWTLIHVPLNKEEGMVCSYAAWFRYKISIKAWETN